MKFSIAVLFAAFATVSAQESNLKNRLVDHRDDQFRDNKVSTTARMLFEWKRNAAGGFSPFCVLRVVDSYGHKGKP